MDNIITFQSRNGNFYQFDFTLGALTSVPISKLQVSTTNFEEKDSNLMFDNNCHFTPIDSHDIICQFINKPDLVFELTERCNLSCDYCIYGPAYSNGDNRSRADLNLDSAKLVVDYIWKIFDENNIGKTEGVIGFYGGEPLLCFETIKRIIEYVKIKQTHSNLSFIFNMTTNAVLLTEKVADFLDENNVELLISLDGNRDNQSFRHFPFGENSFDVVIKNIDLLKKNHFEYFTKYVGFNSVIHKRNSMYLSDKFIFERYGKHPLLSALDLEEMKEEYKDYLMPDGEDDENWKEKSFEEDNLTQNPVFSNAIRFVYNELNFVYGSYVDFFNGKKRIWKPTGTCLPFGRKIFVSSKGCLFPCENVPKIKPFCEIDRNMPFSIDFERIAHDYNNLLQHTSKLCQNCYRRYSCIQCAYHLPNERNVSCKYFMNRKQFMEYLVDMVTELEEHPDMFMRIIERVSVD